MPLENEAVAAEIPAIPAKESTTQQKKASETVNGRYIIFISFKLFKNYHLKTI